MPNYLDYMGEMDDIPQGGGLTYSPTGDFEGYARGKLRNLLALKLAAKDEAERKRQFDETMRFNREKPAMEAYFNSPEYFFESFGDEGQWTPEQKQEMFMRQYHPDERNEALDTEKWELEQWLKSGKPIDEFFRNKQGRDYYRGTFGTGSKKPTALEAAQEYAEYKVNKGDWTTEQGNEYVQTAVSQGKNIQYDKTEQVKANQSALKGATARLSAVLENLKTKEYDPEDPAVASLQQRTDLIGKLLRYLNYHAYGDNSLYMDPEVFDELNAFLSGSDDEIFNGILSKAGMVSRLQPSSLPRKVRTPGTSSSDPNKLTESPTGQ